jgi:Dihydroxynaphthoic acid synthase
VPKDELDSAALAWAEELAQKSPIALQIAKSAYYKAEDMEYEKQFAYMNEAFARLCSTEDAKEGVQAFFDKRRPHWQEK